MSLTDTRVAVIGDLSLHGGEVCRPLTDAIDGWLADLYRAQIGERDDVALVAVGGYGRRELCPYSDLDVVLVHDSASDIETLAANLWYPLWDEGAKLGHAVRTVREAIELARDDLDTATSLLTTRYIAGSQALTAELATKSSKAWVKGSKSWLPHLAESTRDRHRQEDEVAFMLEPSLKEGRGGLRDVHALAWAGATNPEWGNLSTADLDAAYQVILSARVELHRAAGRGGDRLLLQQQDAVAAALGYEDADVLMADVASAARRIAWHSDEAWAVVLDSLNKPRPWSRKSPVIVDGPGVTVRDGRVHLDAAATLDAEAVLRVAIAAVEHNATIAPATVQRFQERELEVPVPWTDRLRALFVELLSAGHAATPTIETLDQIGMFVPFIPEWAPNRSRPQRNAYHRFTVDRHLWETAAEAAALVGSVDRPDLLVVGALLHDVGKGYPGDHTEVGMQLISAIGARMGFPPDDVAVLVKMCEHHLLLPDIATRRDLEDDDTIHAVAEAAGSVEVLSLLKALTEADSIATGPAAWSSWKAGLVSDLANRTAYVLEGGDVGELPRNFPTEGQRERMRRGTIGVHGEQGLLTVMTPDRPGSFSRLAGAVTLNGLDVLDAVSHSEYGIALTMIRVTNSFGSDIDWPKVCASVEDALAGKVALAARINDRIRTYGVRADQAAPLRMVETSVRIDNDVSSSATVLEVAAPNGIGLLYYVTRAISQLDLNITTSKVQTLGDDVVDSFYVKTREGRKVTDAAHCREIELAIRHALKLAAQPVSH